MGQSDRKPVMTTPRYGAALQWAEDLHRNQRRKGKPVPFISHMIVHQDRDQDDALNEF